MPSRIKRKVLFHVNKYQKKIIWPVIIASFIALVMTFYCFEFYTAQITNTDIKLFGQTIQKTEDLVPLILGGLLVILFFIVAWAYEISHRVLGSYQKIIREFDEAILEKKRGPIQAGSKDEMFGELLKRINSLLKR